MQAAANIPVGLTKRKIRAIISSPEKCAEAVSLVYVNNREKGITRRKHRNGYAYFFNGKRIQNTDTLRRIRSMVIPPAWQEVWICSHPDGHLQATGTDAKGRRQYLYHPLWTALRGQTKFVHLYDFGTKLPLMRQNIKDHLQMSGLPLKKVLALIVSLMDHTGMRIGNSAYEKMYGSFGITTMKAKHVTIKGAKAIFSFKGKKGVYQNVTLQNKRLVCIVRQCMHIPGRELFQYIDDSGERRHIDSGMVNSYIREISGEAFTSKDFRTWVGTVCAFECFKAAGPCGCATEQKKKIVEIIDAVAQRLGNTRSVCRKYYIHPAVIDHYTNGTLQRLIDADAPAIEELSDTEVRLLNMLRKTP